MQIIDKIKDYYDYLQYEFGQVDKDSTFDRRRSVLLSEEDFFKYCYKDEVARYFRYIKKYSHYRYEESNYILVLLEIGNIQYILKYENMKIIIKNSITNEYSVKGNVLIDQIFNMGFHLLPDAITLTHFRERIKFEGYQNHLQRWNRFHKMRDPTDIDVPAELYKDSFKNPILKNTLIPSIINDRDVYNALDNYFRSKYNEKVIDIKNTDIQKAENAGFDKKSSFRHPIK